MMTISRFWQFALTAASVVLGVATQQSIVAADDEFTTMIERRVRDWQPTRDERMLDQIGWASDLVEAKQLAKKHERPLFVFTYSGSTTRANAIALQRC